MPYLNPFSYVDPLAFIDPSIPEHSNTNTQLIALPQYRACYHPNSRWQDARSLSDHRRDQDRQDLGIR